MIVAQQDAGGGAPQPQIEASVNDIVVLALVDTGSKGDFVHVDYVSKLPGEYEVAR